MTLLGFSMLKFQIYFAEDRNTFQVVKFVTRNELFNEHPHLLFLLRALKLCIFQEEVSHHFKISGLLAPYRTAK